MIFLCVVMTFCFVRGQVSRRSMRNRRKRRKQKGLQSIFPLHNHKRRKLSPSADLFGELLGVLCWACCVFVCLCVCVCVACVFSLLAFSHPHMGPTALIFSHRHQTGLFHSQTQTQTHTHSLFLLLLLLLLLFISSSSSSSSSLLLALSSLSLSFFSIYPPSPSRSP